MTTRTLLLSIALLGLAVSASAQPQVLQGDPINPSTGQAYILLPGTGLVLPGEDEKFNSDDDVINGSIVGDIDLVIRAGSGATSGPIADPPAGIAAAPLMTIGSAVAASIPEIPFRVLFSDGAGPTAAGTVISTSELDGRGTFVLAYADLDGDGFVGPTASDGNADTSIELQEVYSPVGRQVALFSAGAAQGTLGVRVAAPASVGGLGIALVGGAATGSVGPLFFDGPWVATQLAFMPPTDPRDLVGRGNVPPPDPSLLVEVRIEDEFEPEEVFLPPPGHPVLGTPYAIPLDGSSPTVGLARSESGPAVCAGLALAVSAATYQPVPHKQLLALTDSLGSRVVAERVDAIAPLGDGTMPTVVLYAADRTGNPADPAGSLTASVTVGPGAGLSAPDLNGDSHTEIIQLSSAVLVPLTLDAGGSAAGTDRLTVSVGGTICSSLAVGGTGTGGVGDLTGVRTNVIAGRAPESGRIRLRADMQPVGPIDLAAAEVEIQITAGPQVLFSRVIPAGSFASRGSVHIFRDGDSVPSADIDKMVIRGRRDGSNKIALLVRHLDLRTFDLDAPSIELSIRIGSETYSAGATCSGNARGTLARCRS